MRKAKECSCVILAAFFFGIMPTIVKDTYSSGGNGINIAFYMALLSIPVYCLIIHKRHSSFRLKDGMWWRSLVAGCADAGTFVLLFLSYSYIQVGIATMLNFIYPVMVALGLHWFFREKLGIGKILALLLYLAGMLLLYKGDYSVNLRGFGLALASGLCYTIHAIFLDKSGLAQEDVYVVGLYKAVVVLLVTGAVGFLLHISFRIEGMRAWGSIFFVALICRLAANALIMVGIRGLGAFIPSILSAVEPIVALLTGWIILKEKISGIQLLGSAMIVAAAVTVVLDDGRKSCPARRDSACTGRN